MLAWAGVAVCLSGCAGGGSSAVLGPTPASSVSPVSSPPDAGGAAKSAAKPTRSLAAVHSWTLATSLPPAKPAALLAALTALPEEMLIVDPAAVATAPAPKDATAVKDAAPPPKPLTALQQNGRRRVLALLDIGEIAKTNPAWQASWADDKTGKLTADAPAWLEAADSKTSGVYPVKYWDADWQKIVTASLDKLLDAGYDGVCVQGVGAFSRDLKGRSSAGTEMAAFVDSLAAHARKRAPSFSVLVDGGVALPAALTDAQRKDYLDAVDGVLARDVFYSGDKPADNDLAPQADVLAALDTFQKAEKPVFVTERLTDPDKIADFLARAKSKGYLPDAALARPTPPAVPAAGALVAASPP